MHVRMLIELESLLKSIQPDLVIVYGDTNSTLAGALSAAQLNIPLAHVESGLRSYRMEMPEEKNRKITDHISTYLFCPTHVAVKNLEREGVTDHVYWVGDLMYDMALQVEVNRTLLNSLNLKAKGYDLMTMHRAEICDHISVFTERLKWLINRQQLTNRPMIWPVHPRARLALSNVSELNLDALTLINPVGYRDMATLIQNAHEIYTDSGGVQREAFFHQVPCTTLRDESEWIETVKAGWNRLWDQRDKPLPVERQPPTEFGSGDTSLKIAEILTRQLLKTRSD